MLYIVNDAFAATLKMKANKHTKDLGHNILRNTRTLSKDTMHMVSLASRPASTSHAVASMSDFVQVMLHICCRYD